jgi:phosphotransferase system  glucose/maltose/N-acetylglucosamine-specific IIC component
MYKDAKRRKMNHKNILKAGIISGAIISLYFSIKGSMTNGWFTCMNLTQVQSCNVLMWLFQVLVFGLIFTGVVIGIIYGVIFLFRKVKDDEPKEEAKEKKVEKKKEAPKEESKQEKIEEKEEAPKEKKVIKI